MQLILASASPRRREILSQLGVSFRIVSTGVDETCALSDPGELTEELSLRKARATLEALRATGEDGEDLLILAADTVVASPDGELLGKPHDSSDAERMLRSLSGRRHTVTSGITLLCGDRAITAHETTAVTLDHIPETQLVSYLKSSEPYDKAGAYAIQGMASLWISGIEGDYFNVVGLPVHLLEQTLRRLLGVGLTDLSNA